MYSTHCFLEALCLVLTSCFSVISKFVVLQSSHWARGDWLLYFTCLLQSCDCWCFVSLPHGAVSWSAVCDCGITWSYYDLKGAHVLINAH